LHVPNQRIVKGKTRIEQVKGYCSSYRAPYPKIALEEKIPVLFELLFLHATKAMLCYLFFDLL